MSVRRQSLATLWRLYDWCRVPRPTFHYTTHYGTPSTPNNTPRHTYDTDETLRPSITMHNRARQLDIPHHFNHNLMHHLSSFQYPLTTRPTSYDKSTNPPTSNLKLFVQSTNPASFVPPPNTTNSQNRDAISTGFRTSAPKAMIYHFRPGLALSSNQHKSPTIFFKSKISGQF